MTISKDLMLSILSLDAYNRGYGAGIGGLSETGQIGSATLKTRDEIGVTATEYTAWQAAGFYAVSYEIGEGVEGIDAGTTVISYRGTNNFGHSSSSI